jgi:hypothetical protein
MHEPPADSASTRIPYHLDAGRSGRGKRPADAPAARLQCAQHPRV